MKMAPTTTQVQVELTQETLQDLEIDETLVAHLRPLSKTRSIAIIASIAGVSFLNTLGTGLPTVALVQIQKDLKLPSEPLLW